MRVTAARGIVISPHRCGDSSMVMVAVSVIDRFVSRLSQPTDKHFFIRGSPASACVSQPIAQAESTHSTSTSGQPLRFIRRSSQLVCFAVASGIAVAGSSSCSLSHKFASSGRCLIASCHAGPAFHCSMGINLVPT